MNVVLDNLPFVVVIAIIWAGFWLIRHDDRRLHPSRWEEPSRKQQGEATLAGCKEKGCDVCVPIRDQRTEIEVLSRALRRP